jgi:ABC-type glutathione transport system ATPase component
MSDPILKVSELSVVVDGLPVLNGISFEVEREGVVAIAGEPGAGKSVVALTILGLTRQPGVQVSGEITFAGRDLLGLSEGALREIRGEGIGLAFADPLSSLHPCHRLGAQVSEAVTAHHPVGKMAARDRALDLLEAVGIEQASRVGERYPHEVSAIERRLASLAVALANGPQLLIAENPTGGLDPDQTAVIEALLGQLRCGVLITTRDRGLAARLADEMLTLEGGRITERLGRHHPEAVSDAPPEQPVKVRVRSGGLLGRLRRGRRGPGGT